MRAEGGRPVNGIASELPMQRIGDLYYVFWQWKWMSVVIRLKVPIEMHYTVIPMGTSKVNSSWNLPCLMHLECMCTKNITTKYEQWYWIFNDLDIYIPMLGSSRYTQILMSYRQQVKYRYAYLWMWHHNPTIALTVISAHYAFYPQSSMKTGWQVLIH